MNRLVKFLVLSVFILTVALASPMAGYSKVLKLGNVQPPTMVVQKGLQYFADSVYKRTNGEIEIQVFPASQLGTEQEILEGVQLGTIHMFEGSTGSAGRFLPELEAFAGPFLWKDLHHMLNVTRGSIGEHLNQRLIKKNGMRILDMGWLFGHRNLTTKNKAVYKPADVKGLKIRVQPTTIYLEMIRAMGGSPTPIDWKEVYMSLQTGVVDGQENPIGVIYSAKLNEVQNYLMLTQHITQNQIVIINESVFQGLTPEQRGIIQAAVIEAGDYQNALIEKGAREDLEKLKKAGMNVIGPDEGLDREAFRQATKKVYDLFKDKWEPGFIDKVQSVR
jgi:tripartite ATP-independent transporter DctP family solute receptor